MTKDSVEHNPAENPNISYMTDCYAQKVMPFPVFSKIKNQMLRLVGYHLNAGYCEALHNFFEQQTAYESMIESLILHDNNLEDGSFARLLDGVSKFSKLKHLHYGFNELGHDGNKALLKLFRIAFPNQLKSLVLTNLKTTGKAVKRSGDEAPEEVDHGAI